MLQAEEESAAVDPRALAREADRADRFAFRPAWRRHVPVRPVRLGPLIAYDLETEPISAGTPRPLYLTAYGEGMHLSTPLRSMTHLRQVLEQEFLTEDRYGARFVGWNANRFDGYFVAAAIVTAPSYRLRPYLTQSGALRGLLVTLAEDGERRTKRRWEFLDGMAMTGLAGVPLARFLERFAPEFRKLEGAIDWDGGEVFDVLNPHHVAYAERDSEGLWHAMQRAQAIVHEAFGEQLRATVGSTCIRIVTRKLPERVEVDAMPPDAMDACREYALRGGFCYLQRKYTGPIWKFDLNQAYAASMRDAALPAGGMLRSDGAPHPKARAYMVLMRARKPGNVVPFYARVTHPGTGAIRSLYAREEIPWTWLMDCEHRQLVAEGWEIQCEEVWEWGKSFNLADYVGELEQLRTTAPGGPAGAIGTMIKAIGNNSFGKTAEHSLPLDFAFAADCPPGYEPYFGDGDVPLDHVWYRIEPRRAKPYHQPQIAAAITAHCRMVLRRAMLIDPQAWLYADTDCVVFDRDVTASLRIDPGAYGAWKVEVAGEEYQLIAKKVYRDLSGHTKRAKGLRADQLSGADWDAWARGEAPMQSQTQLLGLLSVLSGGEMYRTIRRSGTAINTQEALHG